MTSPNHWSFPVDGNGACDSSGTAAGFTSSKRPRAQAAADASTSSGAFNAWDDGNDICGFFETSDLQSLKHRPQNRYIYIMYIQCVYIYMYIYIHVLCKTMLYEYIIYLYISYMLQRTLPYIESFTVGNV